MRIEDILTFLVCACLMVIANVEIFAIFQTLEYGAAAGFVVSAILSPAIVWAGYRACKASMAFGDLITGTRPEHK